MANKSDYNSYKALKAKCLQACKFCSQRFNNRFSSIVHNASHITIPLLKLQFHYCEICHIHFSSTNDFIAHKKSTHTPLINNNNDNINSNIQIPNIKLEESAQPNIDEIIVLKEEVSDEDPHVLPSKDESVCDTVKETEKTDAEDDFKNEEEYTNSIMSQLKFEIDHEYSGVQKNFTQDCEVNIQYTWSNTGNLVSESDDKSENSITNKLVYEESPDDLELGNVSLVECSSESDEDCEIVQSSNLMSFGDFVCKYCSVHFQNRFSLIVHQATHIRITRPRFRCLVCPQCDKYIAGNYRTVQRHEQAVHGNICSKKLKLKTCDMCSLRYKNYLGHIKNYHPEINELQKSTKKTVKDPDVHSATKKSIRRKVQNAGRKSGCTERRIYNKVCDLCCSFYKNSNKRKYVYRGTLNYKTERPCFECKKLFSKLKNIQIVNMIPKINKPSSDRIPFTNETRLKNIQVRLEMINKLGN